MRNESETTILKEGHVKITNLRAIIGPKTYAISNITSVHLYVREPNLFLPVFFAVTLGICSALVAISDLEEYSRCLQVGIYAGIAGMLFLIISRKTKYSIQLANPVSELTFLETYDGNFAERVVMAINKAIAKEI